MAAIAEVTLQTELISLHMKLTAIQRHFLPMCNTHAHSSPSE